MFGGHFGHHLWFQTLTVKNKNGTLFFLKAYDTFLPNQLRFCFYSKKPTNPYFHDECAYTIRPTWIRASGWDIIRFPLVCKHMPKRLSLYVNVCRLQNRFRTVCWSVLCKGAWIAKGNIHYGNPSTTCTIAMVNHWETVTMVATKNLENVSKVGEKSNKVVKKEI